MVKLCEGWVTKPVISTRLWLYVGGSFLSWQAVTLRGSSAAVIVTVKRTKRMQRRHLRLASDPLVVRLNVIDWTLCTLRRGSVQQLPIVLAGGWDVREFGGEKVNETFRVGGVRKEGIAKCGVRKASAHRELDRGHHLAGVGSKRRESENGVVLRAYEGLEETLCLSGGTCAQNGFHRQGGETLAHFALPGLRFVEADAR